MNKEQLICAINEYKIKQRTKNRFFAILGGFFCVTALLPVSLLLNVGDDMFIASYQKIFIIFGAIYLNKAWEYFSGTQEAVLLDETLNLISDIEHFSKS